MDTSVAVALLGHKDHGKSTFIGRMLLDTKSIKSQKIQELQQLALERGAAWDLAHLVDSFREEREAMMTLDTTQVALKGRNALYELIDVPGHGELLAQLVTGACHASTAVLIVSVTEGIQEQTRQHVHIARLLGISRLLVAVNKMDLVRFGQGSFERLAEEIKAMLAETGDRAEYVFPVSALTGANIVTRTERMPWYQGPSVCEYFEQSLKPDHGLAALPLRFVVQDTYRVEAESVVVGKVESGKLASGHDLMFVPGQYARQVTALRDAEGTVDEVPAGRSVTVLLSEPRGVARGMVGAPPGNLPHVSKTLQAKFLWFVPPSSSHLSFECGTAQVKGELATSGAITIGAMALATVRLDAPLAFDPGANTPLGKLVAKARGRIIGVGSIVNGSPASR